MIKTLLLRRYACAASWLLVVQATIYGAVMIVFGGGVGGLYAPSPYHRWQSDALLHGRLYIGNSISQIAHDNAWYNGQVNHVWGLGVGLWLAPFEALWRLFGQKWFPDRIALGVAFSLLAVYVCDTGWRIGRQQKVILFGVGFIWLILCCPSLWTLNFGPRLVYEETALYATLLSLAILTSVLRFTLWGGGGDFFTCAILAALSPMVRPTHGVYGLAGVIVCSVVILLRREGWRRLLVGNAIFGGGLALLALSNWTRFGAAGEFGHRLTVTPDVIVYTTRLGNDMERATLIEAGRELLGAMFFTDPRYKWTFDVGDGFIQWQAPYPRWREPYIGTFDSSWLLLCLMGVFWGVFYIFRKFRSSRSRPVWGKSNPRVCFALLLWAVITLCGLGVFYLRLATFSSRYLLDFGPALVSLMIVGWWMWPRRLVTLGAVYMAAWIGYEIVSIKVLPMPAHLLTRNQLLEMAPMAKGRSLTAYAGRYDAIAGPGETRIAYNGYGWNVGDEMAGHIVILAVDRPQFIELELSPRISDGKEVVEPDVYRAMINARFLSAPEVMTVDGRIKVRFSVTEEVLKQGGDELIFLWFGRDYSDKEKGSRRNLYSVRWR